MPHSPELRQQIEDLALRLVVEDTTTQTAAWWIPALERIRDSAQREQASRVSAAAAAILDGIRPAGDSAGDEGGRMAAALQDGITCLQQALEFEKQPAAVRDLPLAQDPELISDFILESREHLAAIEAQVLTIERDPRDAEALNSVFRGFHTIKGLAGFLELWEVQKLAHEVETVLDLARNSRLTITPAAIDVILQGADYLRRWVTHLDLSVHQRASDAPPRDEPLLDRIHALSGAPSAPAEPPAGLAAIAAAVETPPPEEAPARLAASSPATRRNEAMAVKVDTAKLDYLADMAGEMVIAESLVRHDTELGALKSPKLQRKIAQLTRITAELQKTAMAMRVVPIGPLFRRMARLVRDLARQFGKRVEMETQGDEIELDRTIVEELADPLMHMVRNALDHGLEPPEERQACGKNPIARVLLKAQHQAGQVVIEITDDGRGLNRDKIRAKAIERGVIASGDGLTDAEIYNIIFLPGFSTATTVTNVSGRGVGMDVVRRHIERLRGRIEVRSAPGSGSTFLLKLPLTLAIIDGLVVGVGKERYIVPIFAVREMFRPARETLWTVEQRGEMALVRGSLLPVLRLYRRFGVKPRSEDPLQSLLVVAEAEGQRFCLLVDELIGKQEVVIKTLGELFRNVPGVAGGAILGDGRVGLILDVERLYKEKPGDGAR
jgi:two-component system chemotaxis sensor kinase CheA